MTNTTPVPEVRALLFDVFGTVVDWRGGIIREGEALAARAGIEGVNWGDFADRWRSLYQPSMEAIRTGQRPFVILDVLHRENLEVVLHEFGLDTLPAAERDEFNRAWHRLDPWPDSVPGLERLKTRYILGTQSNGNIALMVNMAKHGGLPWDVILGAEPTGHYKPDPECYRKACQLLDLPPEQCMMVAAHTNDLRAAREACGMRTAYIYRPYERGPGRTVEAPPEDEFDVFVHDMVGLAERMGC